jgi:hypothetical protein
MTLVLSVVKKDFAVIGADGSEFRHRLGQPKTMDVLNRQKLFPLPGRSIVLAVFGLSALSTVGKDLTSQRLVGEMLMDVSEKLSSVVTVAGVAQSIGDLMNADVLHTFGLVQNAGFPPSHLRTWVIGFDSASGRSRGWDVFWPMLPGTSTPRVTELVRDIDDVRVMADGTGGQYVEAAIKRGALKYDRSQLLRASVPDAQRYVRSVYRDALALQTKDDPEFGGDYSEVTITRQRVKWK